MARRALKALRNEDYTDRELLHILDDAADEDGWATSHDLHEKLRIAAPDDITTDVDRDRYARHCIATRYSWMVRYGWCDRDREMVRWRVNDAGRALMDGSLSSDFEAMLRSLKPGDRVLVMRELGKGYRQTGTPAQAMLRREWQHQSHRRRNGA
jgi:hypothetical protein